MGGDFSEVTDRTMNVVVEGAIFDPVSIRHTSRRLNLRSESSSRFEKVLQQNLLMKQSIELVIYLNIMLLVKY